MNSPLRLAALACLLLPVACAASPEQRVPLPDQKVAVTNASVTRIYFVREDSGLLENRAVRIFDGEQEIGTLDRGSYLCWERAGGRSLGHAVYEAVDRNRGELEGLTDLDCAAGSVHYFNIRVTREYAQPKIEPLTPEDGRRLVSERHPAKTK